VAPASLIGRRAATVASNAAIASRGKRLGQSGALFRRGGKVNGGVLNRNNVLKIGYSLKGSAANGNTVFRVAWGKKEAGNHGHFVLRNIKD